MKKFLVSYANKDYLKRQKELEESALKFGIDENISWTEDILKNTTFYRKNGLLLNKHRGAGYWIWKPYIIYETLKRMEDGDALVYADSGAEIVSSTEPLIKLCEINGGILLFNAVNQNMFYTKRDCFKEMGCDFKTFWIHPQFMGGYQVYIKNKISMKFVEEYLRYVQIPHLVDDSPSIATNFEGFIEHRHDQSILTNLAIKNFIVGYRNPSQGGNHLKMEELRVKGEILNHPYSKEPDIISNYPQIFFNKRNTSDFKLFLIKLRSRLPIKLQSQMSK